MLSFLGRGALALDSCGGGRSRGLRCSIRFLFEKDRSLTLIEFHPVRKWVAYFFTRTLQTIGKVSFLEQAKALGRNSTFKGATSLSFERSNRLTSLLNCAMGTEFFRRCLKQDGVNLESLEEGATLGEAQAQTLFTKLVPISKRDIRSRFPEGVLTA
jgi:hypothetical protein